MKHFFYTVVLIISVLLFLIFCCSCNGKSNPGNEKEMVSKNMVSIDVHAEIGDSFSFVHSLVEDRLIVNRFCCIAWKNNDGYELICSSGDCVEALVRFSNSLEPIKQENIDLIPDIRTDEWIGEQESLFVLRYGPHHFDAGSGFYIPAYISCSGNIYYLSVKDGVICSITVQSLQNSE